MGVALAFQLITHVGLIDAHVDPLSSGGPKRVWPRRALFMPLPAGRGAYVEREAAEQKASGAMNDSTEIYVSEVPRPHGLLACSKACNHRRPNARHNSGWSDRSLTICQGVYGIPRRVTRPMSPSGEIHWTIVCHLRWRRVLGLIRTWSS